jgi:hypothetical protein
MPLSLSLPAAHGAAEARVTAFGDESAAALHACFGTLSVVVAGSNRDDLHRRYAVLCVPGHTDRPVMADGSDSHLRGFDLIAGTSGLAADFEIRMSIIASNAVSAV